jgi:formylglycine-generating enzyme required for sulfatase activity
VALGDYGPDQLSADLRLRLTMRLLQWYRDDPDSGVHGAVDWLLHHAQEGSEPRKLDWGQAAALKAIDIELRRSGPDGKRGWYVNGQGETMALIPGPVEFRMGAPGYETQRREDEVPHWQRVGRSFAVASKPVTVEEFQRFLKERPDVAPPVTKDYSPDADGPIIGVSWFMAAQYCNWLSEKEGIPESEWCYPRHAAIREAMKPFPDYLKRKGYRLPTEAEWEVACRSGTVSSHSYGSSEELLPRYAWFLQDSHNRAWPVGQKRPNDLGLFDMHGDVWTWCQDAYGPYKPGWPGRPAEDEEDKRPIEDRIPRVLRGGSFVDQAEGARSACRSSYRPSYRYDAVGLRVARTCE